MYRRHQSLFDSEGVFENFGHGSETVRRTRGVRYYGYPAGTCHW
jgi:hypothetical protein